jgi:hypothetical protein
MPGHPHLLFLVAVLMSPTEILLQVISSGLLALQLITATLHISVLYLLMEQLVSWTVMVSC